MNYEKTLKVLERMPQVIELNMDEMEALDTAAGAIQRVTKAFGSDGTEISGRLLSIGIRRRRGKGLYKTADR